MFYIIVKLTAEFSIGKYLNSSTEAGVLGFIVFGNLT